MDGAVIGVPSFVLDWLVEKRSWLLFGLGQEASLGAKTHELAFQQLLDRNYGALARLCAYRERDRAKRDDLWQEILVALWTALPKFRGEGSERAWVLRIAHNVCATHVLRAMRGKQFVEDVGIERIEGTSVTDEGTSVRELLAVVERLDMLSQQLILLTLEGLSSAEISQATGLSETHVTTRLSRLRTQLARRGRPT